MYIPRSLDLRILEFITDSTPNKNVLLVEGARQVGKSSLVLQALEKCKRKYFAFNLEKETLLRSVIDDCEEFNEFNQVLKDRVGFDGDSGYVLFIDEAQESRKLGRFVRFMKEEWRNSTVILTGSTLSRLFRDDIRYPVGRVQKITLWPFSFSEFLRGLGKEDVSNEIYNGKTDISFKHHQYLLELYDLFLITGGLPEIVIAHANGKGFEIMLDQLIADYENDFVRIFGENDIAIVKSCFKSVANFVGSPSKNTSVIPSPSTPQNARINDIFARLESWHLLIKAEQKGPSAEANHSYLPKRYMFDTGILRRLRESAWPSISVIRTLSSAARIPLGGALENQCAIDISRFNEKVFGWKKYSSGCEIDFIVKKNNMSVPVECKASLKFDRKHIRGLLDYMSEYNVGTGILVSLAPYQQIDVPEIGKIINMPAYMLEALDRFI
ncbi:MAG: AAA family ATPase [Lentisphaerota bacterium]